MFVLFWGESNDFIICVELLVNKYACAGNNDVFILCWNFVVVWKLTMVILVH